MKKKQETTSQEIVNLLGLPSDEKLRCFIESLLDDARKVNLQNPLLELNIDIPPLLSRNKITKLVDLEILRELRKEIEARIENLIEHILCLLEKLRKQVKIDHLEKKRLLRMILSLINLNHLKNLIERLDTNIN